MKPVFTFLIVIILGATVAFAQKPDNSIRIESLVYVMPDKETGEFNKIIQPFDGFELLAFDSNWGRMKPRAVFRNLTQNNYINFTVCANILDPETSQYVYNHELFIGSAALMDGKKSGVRLFDSTGRELFARKNVPPGARVEVTFKEFFPNENYVYTDGCLILKAFSKYNDINTADDTLSFCVETIVIKDGIPPRSITSKINADSTFRPTNENWISKGVDVVDAWDYTNCMHNNGFDLFKDMSIIRYGEPARTGEIKVLPKKAPVYCLNRVDLTNTDNQFNISSGDTIISQIINLIDKRKYELIISLIRATEKINDYHRGRKKNKLLGTESRISKADNKYEAVREPDKLIVEFISVNDSCKGKIINPKEEDWSKYPGTNTLLKQPPLTIFGGGGYVEGFRGDTALTFEQGLKFNQNDHGEENAFTNYSIAVPDTFINYGKYFRFRLRVSAVNNGFKNLIKDDYDNFIIEDLYLIFSDSYNADLAVTNIVNGMKNDIISSKRSTLFNTLIKVENPSDKEAPSFSVKSYITIGQYPDFKFYYDYFGSFTSLNTLISEILLPFISQNDKFYCYTPNYYKKETSEMLKPGLNSVHALIFVNFEGEDMNSYNNILYGKFNIYVDKSIGYDDPVNVVNDVPEFSGVPGSGLNLLASSNGTDDYSNCYGYPDGNGSGQIAVRFRLDSRDTVFGFQAFFAENARTDEDVRFCIYSDTNSMNYPIGNEIPYQLVPGSEIYRKKVLDDFTNELKLNQYVTYLYEKPVVLDAGTYWAAIGQTGREGLNLGGSKYRMGMATTVYDSAGKGKNGVTVMLNNAFNSGVNENVFAYQNIIDKGKWVPFMPTKGNPAFSYLDHAGTITKDDESYRTFQRGTFAPMLRIYMDGSHYKPVSVNETDGHPESGYLSISPNPAGDYIVIDVGTNGRSPLPKNEIRVYNSIGECVLTENVGANGRSPLRLDTSNLSPGIYFLRCGGQITKFIKM